LCYKGRTETQEFCPMPPKLVRLWSRALFTLIAVLFVVPVMAQAQTGRVTLQGRVSETVTLSVPDSPAGNVEVLNSGNTVRLTLSGSDAEVRLPLLVRSNTRFKISAVFESPTAALSQLSVIDAVATGALTSPNAVNALAITPPFEPLDPSQPLIVFSGPRVSLGGTLRSSNNALQVTLLIRVQPQPARDWLAHLTFVATPE
jgi:hypothetical protein